MNLIFNYSALAVQVRRSRIYQASARRLVNSEMFDLRNKEHRCRRECNNLAQLASGLAHHVSCLRISIEAP